MSDDPPRNRAQLLERLERAVREGSAHAVIFSHAVAEKAGMNSTDMECLDLLSLWGPLPAGRLSELTRLTTGAMTTLIDRLEKAGFVRREADPGDRRKVIVRPLQEAGGPELEPLFGYMQQAMLGLFARYTEQELLLLLDFATGANAIAQQATARLRQQVPPARRTRKDPHQASKETS